MKLTAEIATVAAEKLLVKATFMHNGRVVHLAAARVDTPEEASAAVEKIREALLLLSIEFTEPQAAGG